MAKNKIKGGLAGLAALLPAPAAPAAPAPAAPAPAATSWWAEPWRYQVEAFYPWKRVELDPDLLELAKPAPAKPAVFVPAEAAIPAVAEALLAYHHKDSGVLGTLGKMVDEVLWCLGAWKVQWGVLGWQNIQTGPPAGALALFNAKMGLGVEGEGQWMAAFSTAVEKTAAAIAAGVERPYNLLEEELLLCLGKEVPLLKKPAPAPAPAEWVKNPETWGGAW